MLTRRSREADPRAGAASADEGFTGAISPTTETFPVTGLTIRLDNLYARAVPLVAAGVEHVPGSDHWPIWIDVNRCGSASR